MQFSVGNQDEFGNVALQIQQRMKFDRAFGFAKPGPGKHRQAEVDRRCIERVDRRVQFDAEFLVGIQFACLRDEDLREVGVDPPVAGRASVREVVAGDAAANPHVVQLGLHRPQTGLDVAEALAIRQLRKGHHAPMFVAGKGLDLVVPAIAIHTSRSVAREAVPSIARTRSCRRA